MSPNEEINRLTNIIKQLQFDLAVANKEKQQINECWNRDIKRLNEYEKNSDFICNTKIQEI
jgi:hypothetical protein